MLKYKTRVEDFLEKISIKKFVELLYAQLAKQDRYDITVDEIGNAILILKKAPMFSIYKNILKDLINEIYSSRNGTKNSTSC